MFTSCFGHLVKVTQLDWNGSISPEFDPKGLQLSEASMGFTDMTYLR